MGVSQNLMYLCIVVGIISYVAIGTGINIPAPTYLSLFLNPGNGPNGLATGSNGVGDFPLYANITILIIGAIGLGFVGNFSFPNPYAIFGLITLYIFLTFAVVPFNLFNQLPYPANSLLTILTAFIMIFGVLDWYKGGIGEL